MSIPDLAIREIRARPVVAPLPRPIRTASGDVLDAPLLLIDVLTDAGVTGRAYAFAYTPLTLRSLTQFVRDIAPELVGESVNPRARMRQMEKRLKLVGWQGFAGMVVGTLDMALWDALARAMDVSLALLLDFNQSQSTVGAVERIRRLQDFDLSWVEEPVAAEDLVGHRAVRERVRPVPIQTGENWWFPHGMANAIAAGASDLAMVDIMKIGGVTGWIAAMAQAEAAALPLSNHTFVEPSAHVMAVAPTASWFEYLDIAGAVLTERLLPVDGMITARGPGLGLDWDEHAVA